MRSVDSKISGYRRDHLGEVDRRYNIGRDRLCDREV